MSFTKHNIKLIRRTLVLACALLSIASIAIIQPAITPAALAADPIKDNLCQGVSAAAGGSDDCTEDSSNNIKGLAVNVINIFSWIVGILAVIMLIVGGFRYIISGGDSAGISGAKNTILYAIVGLVIVIFAQTVVKFVVVNVTKDSSSSQPATGGGGGTPTGGGGGTPTGGGGGTPPPTGPGGEIP